MTSQPRQEPFKQAPRGTISSEQHLTSSPFASPLHEGLCLSPGEGLQEEIAEIAAMRMRASHQEPTAQNVVGVSE